MYQKYHTEALVLGNREMSEADRMIVLFTRDFGLVRARASAVRKERSKMRYAVQDYSRAKVSLVKGKRGWRLAGAAALKSATGDRKCIATFARIAELTMRLVHGEEKSEYLFETLANAHQALTTGTHTSVTAVEVVCVARVLYALGYISPEALESTLFTHTAYGIEHLSEVEAKRDKLLSSINKAIAETHL
ncbi:DNA repair protein RecO [Candidatus Kaiserbacteria bacterium]|nr:DNA repair protein RecO [Candidatus Kaiserbacteria bacterium]